MKRRPITALEVVLCVLVVIIWLVVFVRAVTHETRAEYKQAYMIDNTGELVTVYYRDGRQ